MGSKDWKSIIVMVGCQSMYSAVTVSGRAALVENMSCRVFVVYRQCFAFLLIAPFAFFSRGNKNEECSLGWKSFWMISLLALIGVTMYQNIYLEGLYLATSSAGSALGNLVPAVTFLLAYIFGLEKIKVRSIRSIAKIVGTVLSVGGAAAMALLKGPKLLNIELLHPRNLFYGQDTWLLGCLFLLASTFCWSMWLILQGRVSVCYPNHLALTAWMCLIAAVQSAILTLVVEPDLHVWKVTSPFQLGSCFFAGFSSAVTFFGQAWCIARRGPLFSASFSPLSTLIVTIFACIFMHEELYIGSLIGGLVVIIGLYIVLWGKANNHQEMKEENESQIIKSDQVSDLSNLEEPLLSEIILEKSNG